MSWKKIEKEIMEEEVFSGTEIKANLTMAKMRGRPSSGEWHDKNTHVNVKYIILWQGELETLLRFSKIPKLSQAITYGRV